MIPENLLGHMSVSLKEVFNMIDTGIVEKVSEIRMKRGGYITLVIRNSTYFIDFNGDLYDAPSVHCVKLDEKEFDRLFMSLCDYSVHAHNDTVKYGYITLDGGVRVGISGHAVYDGGELITLSNITSLCIRIPRDADSFSLPVINRIYLKEIPSIIVAGAPNSGKTTFLRDLAKQLSNGKSGRYIKVCAVDERDELFAHCSADSGVNTDILSSYPKPLGIEIATRTLSPELIVCDEIATPEEAYSVIKGLACGISFALSVHIGRKEDLYRKEIVSSLLSTGEFSYIVMLDGYTYKPEIINASEVISEIRRSNNDSFFNNFGRGVPVV